LMVLWLIKRIITKKSNEMIKLYPNSTMSYTSFLIWSSDNCEIYLSL
jgi:hypothetical protein